MRLLIIPFNTSFSKPFENEIIEIETDSKEEIQKKLLSLKEGSNYTIEIYKNINDYCLFQVGIDSGGLSLLQKKEVIQTPIYTNIYDTIIDLINLYISNNGSKELNDWVSKKIESEKKIEEEKYNQWKLNYDKTKDSKKKKNILNTFLLFLASFIIILLVFNWLSNIKVENDIIIVKGIVTNTNDYLNINNSCLKQKVYYRYIINDKYYSSDEYRRCDKTAFKENDSIRIKCYIENLNYSSIIGK